MPTSTFFNLPLHKQNKIIDLAIGEFEHLPYDKASVNRIVKESGIAKGSFYQYFEDKKDLFHYVIHLIVEEKLKYLSPLLSDPDSHGFFTVIEELFKSGIQFAREHPRYVNIARIHLADTASPLYREMVTEYLPRNQEIFRHLIELGIRRGEIREDVDVDFLAHLITDMNYSVVDYTKKMGGDILDDQLMALLGRLLRYLKEGIGVPLTVKKK